MSSHRWGPQDPDETVNYRHDWTALLLAGDTVMGAPTIEVDGAIQVLENVMETATVQRVKLTGGLPGRRKIKIGVNTAQGNYWQEGVVLSIREN